MEAFRFKDDQKRALVSRLLQRQCVSEAMSLSWQSVQIKRTKGRKPFVMNKSMDRSGAPNFNFNVSHEVGRAAQICFPVRLLARFPPQTRSTAPCACI